MATLAATAATALASAAGSAVGATIASTPAEGFSQEGGDGGVGGIDLSIGNTILLRVVQAQAKTREAISADLKSFLGGRGLPINGGSVLPSGGGINIRGTTLPATSAGARNLYSGSIQTAVKKNNERDPTERPYDNEHVGNGIVPGK